MKQSSQKKSSRRLGMAAVLVCGMGGTLLTFAADAPGTFKARLEELRKERAENAGPARKTTAKAHADYPWATPDDVNYINTFLEEEWKSLGFPVANECTDGEFIRRASLDVIGRIPTLVETEAFLKDRSADRRVKLVNKLLASPEYGKNWATIWTHLMIRGGRDAGNMQDVNPEAMRSWMENQLNRNVGWDKIVSELLSSSGRWDETPAVNFVIANLKGANATELTSFTTRLFLGVQTQCTECHDHPWNDWKQEQFHGINAFFKASREVRHTTTMASGQVATDYYELREKEITPKEVPDQGATFERRNGMVSYVMPTYIDGRDVLALHRGEKAHAKGKKSTSAESVEAFLANQNKSDDDPIYLRKELAKAIVGKDNPYFAKAIINRLWYHYMGHSFVKNVDDFDNGQDEPSMPDLLDKLSNDLKTYNFDVKRLTRWILTSKAYSQASKHKGKENKDAQGFFTTMLVKPLSPEQLYDSVMTLTDLAKTSKSANTANERRAFLLEFERTFGTDQEQTTAPKFVGTITQSLMMMNSALLKQATSCVPGTFLHRLVFDAHGGPSEKVDAIYLAAYSRKPTATERNHLTLLRQRSKSDAEFLEDVLWIVLNSGEFMLNY